MMPEAPRDVTRMLLMRLCRRAYGWAVLGSAGPLQPERSDSAPPPSRLCRSVPASLLAAAIALWLLGPFSASAQRSAASDDPQQHPARRLFALPWPDADTEQILQQEYLTGSWRGMRDKLASLGITPTLTFATDVLGNPVGGIKQGLRETDNLGVDVTLDLEQLAKWKGGQFHLSFSLRSGTSLSTTDVGNVFNVAQLCCNHTYRLVDVALEQSLWGDAVNVWAGRIATGDDFLTSALYSNFVQTGINGNPFGVLLNLPAVTVYPVATWGARMRVTPVDPLSVSVGVYNNDPTLDDNSNHGVDWSMRGPVFAIAEIAYRLNQGPGATGLPGNYKIGGYYQAGTFPDLFRDVAGGSAALSGLPPRTQTGNGGFYLLLDQMVYREGEAGSPRGLTPFLSLLFAPDQNINQMPFFANGGLVYTGLFPGRPHDTAALGVVYGLFSNQLQRSQRDQQKQGIGSGPQRYELAIELTYSFQVARWLEIQPDLQYVINPGGTGKIRDALVIGFQLAINL